MLGKGTPRSAGLAVALPNQIDSQRGRGRPLSDVDPNPSNPGARLGLGDFDCLETLATLRGFELDLLALAEGFKAFAQDFGVMHEEVFAASVRGDKAVSLFIAEPFYGSCSHSLTPSFRGGFGGFKIFTWEITCDTRARMWKGVEGLLRLTVTRPAVFSTGAVLNLQPRIERISKVFGLSSIFFEKS